MAWNQVSNEFRARSRARRPKHNSVLTCALPALSRNCAAGLACVGLLTLLAGCNPSQTPVEPIPPTVTVAEAYQASIPREVTGNGTTEAIRQVTIRARVKGFLQERLFKQGSDVKKGELLFVIDEVPFKLEFGAAKGNLDEAKAQLQQATQDKSVEVAAAAVKKEEAAVLLASAEARRGKQAYDSGAITAEEYDERRSKYEQSKANLESARATLEQTKVMHQADILKAQAQHEIASNALKDAEVELSYCRMSAPFDGRIGEALVKEGNLVGDNEDTALATIEQLDPIQVNLRPSARFLPLVRDLVGKGQAVELIVQGERPYSHLGSLTFVDNTIDPTTSTFLVKATVPNPDKELLPGDYVRVNLIIGTYENAIVVPERAVIEGQAGQSVLVVDAGDTVKAVPVKALDTYRGLRVLEAGALKPGDQVIVDGLQLVRSGLKVSPRPLETETWPPRLDNLPDVAKSIDPDVPAESAAAAPPDAAQSPANFKQPPSDATPPNSAAPPSANPTQPAAQPNSDTPAQKPSPPAKPAPSRSP